LQCWNEIQQLLLLKIIRSKEFHLYCKRIRNYAKYTEDLVIVH
jgi:hypothetical protein